MLLNSITTISKLITHKHFTKHLMCMNEIALLQTYTQIKSPTKTQQHTYKNQLTIIKYPRISTNISKNQLIHTAINFTYEQNSKQDGDSINTFFNKRNTDSKVDTHICVETLVGKTTMLVR